MRCRKSDSCIQIQNVSAWYTQITGEAGWTIKIFDQDQKINRWNDRWLRRHPKDFLTVIHIKFPETMMVPGGMSNGEWCHEFSLFSRSLSINVDDYKGVLVSVVRPFLDRYREKRKTIHPTNKTLHRLIRPSRHKNERLAIFTITSLAKNVS